MKKIKIIRTSTKPDSLKLHLRGQLKMLSSKYDVIGVSSNEPELYDVEKWEIQMIWDGIASERVNIKLNEIL